MNLILTNAVRLQDKSAAFTSTYNERDENLDIVFDYVTENFISISEA